MWAVGGASTRHVRLGGGVVISLRVLDPVRPGMCAIVYPLGAGVRGRVVDIPRAACLCLDPVPERAERACILRVLECLEALVSENPDDP